MTLTNTLLATPKVAQPGSPTTDDDLRSLGFERLELSIEDDVAVAGYGQGIRWTTLGDVPSCGGIYLFTIETQDSLTVVYAGLTQHLWMVTRGRLPAGGSRPGQRYGRPVYAGETRKRINVLLAEQIRRGRTVSHWVHPIPAAATDRALLVAAEEAAISRWRLREIGWNKA